MHCNGLYVLYLLKQLCCLISSVIRMHRDWACFPKTSNSLHDVTFIASGSQARTTKCKYNYAQYL